MRVRASIDFWREIGASPLILRWIREGVRIDWLHVRPPPPFHHGVSRSGTCRALASALCRYQFTFTGHLPAEALS